MVSESPPPAERLFQGWRKIYGLAQQYRDILPPPPKQTPWLNTMLLEYEQPNIP